MRKEREYLIMCRPCAERFKASSLHMRIELKSLGVDVKGTCDQCGRRRYVVGVIQERR